MRPPNILFILADDMGYGDVRALNPACAFPTPHLDRLAHEGMYFSDAHASSAVCTPSRYSILTGRYCWRTWLKRSVLSGADQPLVEPGRMTVASLLRDAGYRTACIGKWHLGWDWACKPGHERVSGWDGRDGGRMGWIDFSGPISGGPLDHGFDDFFGISGSLDMPPYVYVDGRLPVEEPTAWATTKEFHREGPRMASLRAHNVLATITERTVEWLGERGDDPFFCYMPLTAPHTPIAPAPEFIGASGINPYGDFCMEVDHRVGQVLAALEANGQAENTLVIFTTDNGASAGPSDCAALEAHYGHFCSERYRGYKSDIWDGGHRLPFLCRWPAGIEAGGHCDQTVGLFDLIATAADLVGRDLPDDAGEDSLSLLPALRGEAIPVEQRQGLVHHSIFGRFAIRHGPWKLCRCPGSGGWSLRDETASEQGLPPLQLYHMDDDPGEQRNRAADHPELVDDLTRRLHRILTSGRSTPGAAGQNHGEPGSEAWPQVDWLSEIPERFVIDD